MPVLVALFRFGALLLCACGLPLCLLLLAVADTGNGRLFAVAGLGASLGPVLLFCGRSARRVALGCGVVWFGLTVFLAWRSPCGRGASSARVQHRYLGSGSFSPLALGNLLPEGDQLLMAWQLAPLLDRLFTFRQARQLSIWSRGIYAELEADADFHALGSTLPLVSGAAWKAGGGHAVLYVPPALDRRKPAPVLVFLHGSGGNFKGYVWVLSRLADELGAVLIAPSGGLGWWPAEETEQLLEGALRDAAQVIALDPQATHLLGLSNGGLGVSRAGERVGRRFASLTFLSPVIDERATASKDFIEHWRGRPIHVLTGAADDRIPRDYVEQLAQEWGKAGALVQVQAVPGADHFLIFSHREVVVRQLAGWLRAVGVGAR